MTLHFGFWQILLIVWFLIIMAISIHIITAEKKSNFIASFISLMTFFGIPLLAAICGGFFG